MISVVAALALISMGQQSIPPSAPPDQTPLILKPPVSRFSREAPLPTIPPVMLDKLGDTWGAAQEISHNEKNPYQARIMWIDGTANLDRVNSEEKIRALLRQLKVVGFN